MKKPKMVELIYGYHQVHTKRINIIKFNLNNSSTFL